MNPREKILITIMVSALYCIGAYSLLPGAESVKPENKKIEATRYAVIPGSNLKPLEVIESGTRKMAFRVDGILVQAELNGPLTINFGSQPMVSDTLKTSWIPINDNYGFNCLDTVDFDLDGVEDAIAIFSWGGFGSGWAYGYLCVSSKTRKAYLYESFAGSNYWNNGDYKLPEIKKPFFLLETPDFMPEFSVKIAGEPLSHPECISFLFTQVWNGDGFSYQPIKEFYKGILPIVEAQFAKAAAEPDPNPVKKESYRLIIEDYRKAMQGMPVSLASRKSSTWKLLKEFKPEPAAAHELRKR